ncbi:MAG: gliding motility-associated C-terminal domain-containing protein [Crocinitomicaceae bacterium]|nr:gliding motility-associated C-terminal domain-containing protein [Crocinitomicaceae bacterium]
MNKMKGFSLALLTALSSFAFGQTVIMGDAGYDEANPADCSTFGVAGVNFFDDGAAGNYSPNFNDTTVFCPDLTLGTKMTITFAINAGYTFNVDATDWIYVYDGPSTASPLLGQHNSISDPTGFAYTASWNNPSGCLTVVFISDGMNEGSGWAANVQCGNQNQPFDPHIEAFVNGQGANALNPIDTGFVDVCFGDSILFVAKPIFPYSQETTGYGYSQTVNNVAFDWNISDGGTYPNNDSIWFTPPSRNGFLVDLKITDQFPQIERLLCKVRVSQLPSFAGTGPLEDTVCLGQNTSLVGGATLTDTVGVDIPAGQFQLGGSFAGLTYLPDGSGQQYQAPIDISGFPSGATIANAQDLNQVCITMEHSYLGDLEILLECPNGTQVPLMDTYPGGIIPGGTSGGGTYLGHPFDDPGGGGAGIGWEYCFSSVFNTIGGSISGNLGNTVAVPFIAANPPTQMTDLSAGNSIDPAVVYEPEASFTGFAGCPINGQWTIIVQDNLGTDDGWIFEWGLFFDPSFFPGSTSYQNTIASEEWLSDPTIISGQNDTLLVVQPNTPGNYNYTYQITDDFGCNYDTVVTLYVLPQPTIFNDTLACNYAFYVENTVSYQGGVWSSADTAITFSDVNLENPLVTTSTPGTYTLSYTDNACNTTVTSDIEFPPYVFVALPDTTVCIGTTIDLLAFENGAGTDFVWDTGETGLTITISEPGTYSITGSNICHSWTATSTLDNKLCDIDVPNIISLSSQIGNNTWFVQQEGISEFNCVITNRWGNVVYESNDPAGQWDGNTQNGTLVEEGTYFYIINAVLDNGEPLVKQGFVQVVH